MTTILFHGMMNGSFTGGRYFSPDIEDWRNARRIINGTDKADLIADCGPAVLRRNRLHDFVI